MDSAVLIRQIQGKVRWGKGDPETVVEAPRGVLWLREDGGIGSTLYVKEQDAIAGDPKKGWNAK